MLKQFVDWAASVLFLARDTSENKRAIAELSDRVEALSNQVRDLSVEFRLFTEREKHEREKFMLQVQNVLLQFERRLDPAKQKKRLRKKS